VTARALIVDDHELLGHSLVVALEARGLSAARVPVDGFDAVVDQVRSQAPDVVLLDLQLGEPIGSGLRLVVPCREAGARVLVVTGVTDRLQIAAALEAGAAGYVSKTEPFEALLTAATTVAAGEEVLAPEEREELLSELQAHRDERAGVDEAWARLSAREREVLGRLVAGDPVSRIADDAHVAVTTVRAQVRAIHRKLGVASQLEAVALAARSGWFVG
jgi:DNA-binding NarL/FixJ family response regulator